METFLYYDYYIEQENCARSGEFVLYKNELFSYSDGNKFHKYVNQYATDSLEIYVGTTPPVAFGITAFFYCRIVQINSLYSLLSRGIRVKSFEYYEVYYGLASKNALAENDSNPEPKSLEEVHYDFLKQHIINENKHLELSHIFYSEPNDEIRMEVKIKAKEYVEAYIRWLEKKLQKIVSEHPNLKPKSTVLISPNQISDEEIIVPFEKLDDAQFIKSTVFFFQIFRDLLDLQFRPNSDNLKDHTFLFPHTNGTVYSYHLQIDSKVLSSGFYTRRITNTLIKGVPKDNLKVLLNETYSIVKDISKIPDENLIQRANRKFVMSFDHVKPEAGFDDVISELAPTLEYSNFDIVSFFIRITQFLENTFSFNEAALSSNIPESKIRPSSNNESFVINAVSYFNRIESFLQKIVELFFLQLDPVMKSIRANQLGIGFNHDTVCEYYIHPSTNLLDFTYFKDNFGFLLLQKKKEDEGLQMLLSETFNLCINIMSQYEDRLGYLKQVNTVRIFFQDVNGEISYYRDETDPAEGYEILGSYEVYHYSLKIYEYMLSKGFTPLATTISSEKTNPLIEDVHSVPKQTETEEIINISDESETNVDPEQFISDILEPLTKENFTVGKNKKLVYCIDSSFKTHLTSCFLALIEDTERPKYHPQFKIRSKNAPFYDAIILIMEQFQFKPKDVIIIIADAFNKDFDDLSKGAPDSIRTEISYARTRKQQRNI
jgi:hypothetical protein